MGFVVASQIIAVSDIVMEAQWKTGSAQIMAKQTEQKRETPENSCGTGTCKLSEVLSFLSKFASLKLKTTSSPFHQGQVNICCFINTFHGSLACLKERKVLTVSK